MANGISIDELAAEIAESLKVYSQDVVEKINISSKDIAKRAVKMLQVTSPKSPGGGTYAHSWTVSTDKYTGQPDNRIVHAKAPHYRLTHLLEYGHAKVGGGRVDAIPHIKDAEDWVIDEFQKAVKEAIKHD